MRNMDQAPLGTAVLDVSRLDDGSRTAWRAWRLVGDFSI